MYSNCLYNLEACAHKKFPIAPQIVFYLCQNHILYIWYTLYIIHKNLFTVIGTVLLLLLIKGQPVTVDKYNAQYSHEEAWQIQAAMPVLKD